MEDFAYLFKKYTDQSCTPAERKEFFEIVKQQSSVQQLNALITTALANTETDQQINDEKADELFSAILKAAGEKEVIPLYPEKKRIRIWWAAAAIATLLAGGAYFTLNRGTKQIAKTNGVNERIKNDAVITKDAISPGSNKAVLTLADGSTIVLDNVHNGTISTQGNVAVLKLNDGKLAYNTVNEAESGPVYNSISTPRGGQYQLVLSDGSIVWLNAASSLRFPTGFNGGERKVELTGEAYFEVAKDASKPFRVEVNGMEVEVLGTHFNINSYEDESPIRTTLLEGSVKVNSGNHTVLLKPGQQAELGKRGTIEIKKDADVEEAVAWKNGKFQFDNTSIYSVMHQLSRWYDVDVEYRGDITAHFGGIISRQAALSQVLNMLELTGKVTFTTKDKVVTVRAK